MTQTAHDGDVATLVGRLCDAAIAKGDFASNPSEDHALHRQIGIAIMSLRELGPQGHIALEGLLEHSSPHVRSWVATQLLLDGQPKAVSVLESLGNGSGLRALNARTVLNEFKIGRLQSPFSRDGA
jgi:hypothetical protein